MTSPLKVAPKWVDGRKFWAVWDGDGVRVSGAFYSEAEASGRKDMLVAAERQKRTSRERPCMCCNRMFTSEGIHNRLCHFCGRSAPNRNW